MTAFTPRHPLLATAMSFILPGFGQLYNGQLNKGIMLFIAFIVCSLPLQILAALYLPAALMLPLLIISLLLTLGLWLYGVIQAWKQAIKHPDYMLKDWQKPALYLGTFLIAMLVVIPFMTQYIRSQLAEGFYIPSGSMQPTLLRGDLLFADKRYNCPNCKQRIKRGDIAIFVYPNNRTQYFVKRIIGLPGDRIRIEDKTVFVNDKPLTQAVGESQGEFTSVTENTGEISYQVHWSNDDASSMKEQVVPQGEVFVLGDNRSKSNDSRLFSTVPMMDVVGKARQLWLSIGDDGIRWDRLGRVLHKP